MKNKIEIRLLWGLVAIIFTAELLIMLLLRYVLPPFPAFAETLLDSAALSVIIYPAIYLLLFRPLVMEIVRREELEDKLALFKRIIEEAPEFVAIGDADKRPFYYNKAARKMLGYGADEKMDGIKIEDTHPDWATKLVLEEGLPAAERDGSWSEETAILSRGGDIIPVMQSIMAHRNESGKIAYYSTIAHNILDRKAYEDKLKERAKELEQLNRIMLNREARMAELKEENRKLKNGKT